RKAPRKKNSLPLRRMLILGAVAGGVLLAVVAAWVYVLDQQIVRQFEGRRWNLPAQVYARPLELHAGSRVTADVLEAELSMLGYANTRDPATQGTYWR